MKKFLIGLVTVIVIGVAGLKIADIVVMGGDSYYVQVTTDGEKETERDDQGQTYTNYHYVLPGYNQNGEEKDMEFSAMKERPLRKQAFLRITWNKNKGVTSYEEVQGKDVPKKAQEKLLEVH
ncbi:YxeA family protein [Enterococcus sp. 669A]|uniref:YxeA family protein n=1 Tax=Candidatus Enterococcus moelleringii TaxID=2815325 RepID=A0ABS3L948_9ENTE|nr:YxeA family protein [Enterococcus sp. 669A]MBO1306158.1 YxeA family protein [Enterococcus sp. 669A]